MKKIDIHCHTTNRILKGTANSDASLEAITAHMKAHNIVQTVLLATYFPYKGTGISNYRMYHWIKDKPQFAMFGSLDFEHFFYQGFNELEEMASQQLIKGIKFYTAYQKIDFNSAEFKRVVTLARDHNLPLMFHGGVSYTLWKKLGTDKVLALATTPTLSPSNTTEESYKTPQDFEMIAKEFPTVTIIVSHLCKPFFQDMIRVLNRNDNIFTDMSGILDSKRDAHYKNTCVTHVKKFIDECGPEKILFGTDFPVQTHTDSIYFIEEAMQNYEAEDKQKVYFDNANKLIFKSK